MKLRIQRIMLRGLRHFSPLIRFTNRQIRALAGATHFAQMAAEWGTSQPEFFDHYIDVYYAWLKKGHTAFLERGMHSMLALRGGGATLDLCCGDGFFAKHLYSTRSETVLGVDYNLKALVHAQRAAPANVRFERVDLRSAFPKGRFQNVVWDVAIQHFDEEDTNRILKLIGNSLASDGILSGSTVLDNLSGTPQLVHHKREFGSPEDLKETLRQHFREVIVYTSLSEGNRRNAYFYACNGALPEHLSAR